jgi:speckle-type POZ protein
MEPLDSTLFSAKSTPDRLWKMQLTDVATDLKIQLFLTTPGVAYYYSAKLVDPVRVKIAILNKKRQKILQTVQALPRHSGGSFIMMFPKAKIIENECQQLDGSLTFYSEIESYVKIEPVSGKANDDRDQQPMRNSDKLTDQQEKLFENMKYADVTIKTGGREFLAHKAILASRSQVFDAMFQHSTKEKLSNQVEIEDIHPDVFGQLLRFIYTGRLSLTTMEAMAVGLYAAADKYFLDQLKAECEDHLIRRMSPENCIQLLLDADRQPPPEH